MLLAFDTAGPDCAVALARAAGGKPDILSRPHILSHNVERIGRGHAERLMPMIEEALLEAAISFADLGAIAVTTGPGSFTGIRVGIAAARGLALALSIPAYGIGSLHAFACGFVDKAGTGTIVAVLDAKRGEIYAFAQDLASGAVPLEAMSASPEIVAARLSQAARPLILTGAGAPLLAAALDDARIEGIAEAPDIADVAALGLRQAGNNPPVPLYARGADAKPQDHSALARR